MFTKTDNTILIVGKQVVRIFTFISKRLVVNAPATCHISWQLWVYCPFIQVFEMCLAGKHACVNYLFHCQD